MNRIRVLICQVDDTEAMTEVAAFDLPVLASADCKAASTLDDLETTT